MDCNHINTAKKVVKIDYFGLTFSAKMKVCGDCKAYLWTNESKEKLNHWLSEQKKTNRDRFVVQASLSNTAKECLDEVSKEYPGIQASALIRAMTFVFLHFMENPDTAEMFEMVTDSEIYRSFANQEKHMVKIQFSPSGMMDLHSWSKIVQMKPSKIVEEAVYRITSLHVESDPKLKGFWETQISPQISLILKAVA
jgi:hypothetical protein